MNQIELLAPAGNLDSLIAGVHSSGRGLFRNRGIKRKEKCQKF